MKGLNKLVLVSAIAAAPFAQAELKAIDDATMADISGQSGLLVEVAMGSADYGQDATGAIVDQSKLLAVDWDNAGIEIAAFKWEVDLESYNRATNIHTGDALEAGGSRVLGGVIAEGIKIAGYADITVDGVFDDGQAHGGQDPSGQVGGGIAIGFEGANISMRVDSISVYRTGADNLNIKTASMGAVEILGMNLKNVDLTLSGR